MSSNEDEENLLRSVALQNAKSILIARQRAEDALRKQSEWLRITLSSIGDAVVSTDAEGRVTFLNPEAERMTGWGAAEAIGRHLDDIFLIVNEATRQRVPCPVRKVLETGHVVGLANHTVLIALDGLERPIDDSAAPIRDESGKLIGVVLVFRDITEKHEAARRLRESEEHLKSVFDSAAEGLCVMDPDGRCSYVNAAGAAMLGYRPEELIGRAFDEVIHHCRPDGSAYPVGECHIVRAARGGPRVRVDEEVFWRKDGTAIPVIYSASPMEVGGKNAGAVVTFSDVTERKRAEEALNEANQRKDEFLAMLAHELRNPLAAIGNAVGVTTRSGHKEHTDWAMDVIRRQLEHLTRLIDDLLDVSRISRGKIELRKDVVDATTILDSAVATVGPLVEERKHTLDVSIDRGNLWVDGDPTRLEQVVVNLLNNAAKYSENAGHIDLEALNQGNDVVIAVRDKGVGIPPEKLPEMFELFAQGDRSLARSEGGLGIGLTVVKKLVEMHGGSITAKSEGVGKGSEFTIRLPGARRPTVPKVTVFDAGESASKKSRILVVDDNVDTARGMARLLKLIGHDVATANDGLEALEVARLQEPEFILLDIGLPGMDGYEVVSRLRREECCKDAVIVAVSGYGQDEDRRRSKQAGFDYHLIKPLDHDALLSLLSTGRKGRE
jgi:PAS domain S-box-containing protein